MEHRAINALLNPHFVFNAISNIQSLIHKSRHAEAADYLATLSRLIRQNLENLQYNLISLENELALTERYIKLQNLRFGGNIRLDIIGYSDATLKTELPPLLLHTFVENAVVHGYRKRDQVFIIRVSIQPYEQQYLRIVVSDNGLGIDAAVKGQILQGKSSMGIAFNRKRLQRLSDYYGLRQSVQVRDLTTEGRTGTEATIIISARLKELFEDRHVAVH